MSNIRVPGDYSLPEALPLLPTEEVKLDPSKKEDRLALDLMSKDKSLTDKVALEKAKSWLSMTPAERWEENIKSAKLSLEQANTILDSILQTGYWQKSYSLFNNRLVVEFRTRSAGDTNRVAQALDNIRTNDPNVIQQTVGMVTLACSLVKYNNNILPVAKANATQAEKEDIYIQRRNFCSDTIAGPVLPVILQALSDFDSKVYAALSEGAEHGF